MGLLFGWPVSRMSVLAINTVFGAYPENPSYHKNSPVGAASSREIK